MADYYLYFKRIHKGYYDPRTGLLVSPQGKKNKDGVDPFESGGWAEPGLSGFEILSRYSKGVEVVVAIAEDPTKYLTVDDLENKVKTKKVKKVDGKKVWEPYLLLNESPSFFETIQLTNEAAQDLKVNFFGIVTTSLAGTSIV